MNLTVPVQHVAPAERPASTAGGPSTGAALNPARVLGPAMVFHCYWNTAFVYVFAEGFGATIAALLSVPVYGIGEHGSERMSRRLGGPAPARPPHHQVGHGCVSRAHLHTQTASHQQGPCHDGRRRLPAPLLWSSM